MSSNSRSILLDPLHSMALYLALLKSLNIGPKDKILSINGPVKTADDIVEWRNRTMFVPTNKISSDALFLYSMYDEIRFQLPRKWVAGIDFLKVKGNITPYTDRTQTETDKWMANGAKAAKAKAEIFVEHLRLFDNPSARISRRVLPFDDLFTPDDIVDLQHLEQLVKAKLVYNPVVREMPDDLSSFVNVFRGDPELSKELCKKSAKTRASTQRQMMLIITHTLLDTRDALSDVRSAIEIGSEAGTEISWSSATGAYPIELSRGSGHSASDDRVIVRALLRGLQNIPVPTTIEQTDRLRSSRRMRALWDKIGIWSAALRNGDLDLERDIRDELTGSMKELVDANTTGRRASWAGYTSLPVGVAEILLGLPPVASLSVGAVGVAIGGKSQLAKWKNRWFIWG